MKAKYARLVVSMVVAALLLMQGTAAVAQDDAATWDSLNEAQREVLQPYADTWSTLSPERRARLAQGAARQAGRAKADAAPEREISDAEAARACVAFCQRNELDPEEVRTQLLALKKGGAMATVGAAAAADAHTPQVMTTLDELEGSSLDMVRGLNVVCTT